MAIIILMGHDDRDKNKDYWSDNELYYTAVYSNEINVADFYA
jgi:hypothetical protein